MYSVGDKVEVLFDSDVMYNRNHYHGVKNTGDIGVVAETTTSLLGEHHVRLEGDGALGCWMKVEWVKPYVEPVVEMVEFDNLPSSEKIRLFTAVVNGEDVQYYNSWNEEWFDRECDEDGDVYFDGSGYYRIKPEPTPEELAIAAQEAVIADLTSRLEDAKQHLSLIAA